MAEGVSLGNIAELQCMQEKCHRASFYWISGVWAGGISAQRSHRGAQLCQLGTPNLRKKNQGKCRAVS